MGLRPPQWGPPHQDGSSTHSFFVLDAIPANALPCFEVVRGDFFILREFSLQFLQLLLPCL